MVEEEARRELVVDLYAWWRHSEEWQAVFRSIVTKKTEASARDRFLMASVIAGFAYPTARGPARLKDMPLGDYVEFHKAAVPLDFPEDRQIRVDGKLAELKVSIDPKDGATFQEVLFHILEKYGLDFVVEGNAFVIVKPK